jgi:hypothetical protein
MRVWHDWEFLEDGKTIEPFSVGMVREDGKSLYRVFIDAPWERISAHAWLVDNVIPGLDANPSNIADKETIRDDVTAFLKEAYDVDKDLQLWGWYSAYDHVCLAQLFGRMIDLPSWCPMLTKDLRQEFERAGCAGSPYAPKQLDGNHNALADAKHMKVKHEWFERVGWAQHVHGANKGIQIGNGNTQSNKF